MINEILKNDYITLVHYDEATFVKTNVEFSREHYELAESFLNLPNNVGLIVVSNNKIDLVVAFNYATDRVKKETGEHLYKVIIKPPKK